jgi:Dienelactone hydrolase family
MVRAVRTILVRRCGLQGESQTIQVVGDVAGAIAFLRAQPNSTGKVGVIGFCSGGRHAYLCACQLAGVDAAIDCWGGNVIVDDKSQLNANRPVAPIDLSSNNKRGQRMAPIEPDETMIYRLALSLALALQRRRR